MITGGFETIQIFENADYISEYSIGFHNIGLIYWSPWILTDENHNIKFAIPNNDHHKVKVLLEGFTFDGTLISETNEIEIEK